MCGITGCVNGDMSFMRAMLVAMTSRGKDSTGISVINSSGDEMIMLKDATDADEFVRTDGFSKFAKETGHELFVALGHTRLATTGAITSENAHPFQEGKLVGTHNGMVHNHQDFDKDASVDSQALYRAISRVEPELDEIKKVLEKVAGYYSLQWYDFRSKLLYIAVHGAPFYWVRVKYDDGTKSIYWSSEELPTRMAAAYLGAIGENGDVRKIPDGNLLAVDPKKGEVVETIEVSKPVFRYATTSSSYDDDWGGYGGYYGTKSSLTAFGHASAGKWFDEEVEAARLEMVFGKVSARDEEELWAEVWGGATAEEALDAHGLKQFKGLLRDREEVMKELSAQYSDEGNIGLINQCCDWCGRYSMSGDSEICYQCKENVFV